MSVLSLAMKDLAWPLHTWKLIRGEAITGPVGSTTGANVVVINVGGGGVPDGHPLPGA